jgi:hypothetical protein
MASPTALPAVAASLATGMAWADARESALPFAGSRPDWASRHFLPAQQADFARPPYRRTSTQRKPRSPGFAYA